MRKIHHQEILHVVLQLRSKKMKKGNKNCECSGPGYCNRHKVNKTEREFQLCSGQNCHVHQCVRYWNAWERGFMPGQSGPVKDEKLLNLRDLVEDYDPKLLGKKGKSYLEKPKNNITDIKNIHSAINHLENEEGVNINNIKEKDPEGLGDTLERVFQRFGVTQEAIQKFMGSGGCKCNKRKRFLNQLFPYTKKEKNE